MKRYITESTKYFLKHLNLPVGAGVSIDAYNGQIAANLIRDELLKNKPTFIARFGWTELDAIIAYTKGIEKDVKFGVAIKFLLKNFINNPELLKSASGFFSNDINNVKKFCQFQISIMDDIDIYASWMKQEKFIEKYLQNATKVSARSLFDPFVKRPWTTILEGKKVLIIHPFTYSIEHQYSRRENLFLNKSYLPNFDLQTYKPIQVIDNSTNNYKTWWEALKFMQNEISSKNFDIALLGCGAFGHPLCAHIKKMGKKAIYLGGDLQLMFGIYGDRWIGNKNINKYWIRPLIEDLSPNASINSYSALKNYI